MKYTSFSQPLQAATGFALISVLALVSLAAMTATAFLASARLERQATRPLSQSIQLEWALASGEKCVDQLISDGFEPASGTAKNFVTTLWRGANSTDYTNETGYLLIGEPNANNSVKWTYWAGFSTAGLTNLSTTAIGNEIKFTNAHHGTYPNDCSVFMSRATANFITNPSSTNTVCTTIELLGGQTSPPVGWVYLTQRKRPAGSMSDAETPVARVAWFTEDLAGKIDAERMGLSTTRPTGTNSEEISLTSLIRTNGNAIFSNTLLFTNTTNRKLFFTPGILANSNISGLTNTADLRYFATGLREFRPTNNIGGTNGYCDWIPSGIPAETNGSSRNPYKMSGYTKANLNNFLVLPSSSALTNIANFIRTNIPNFTNRAGGMNGTNYVLALAANIIDYADPNSIATSTNLGGTNIVGFDSYPMLTHIYDNIVYTSGANANLSITTYLQLWNPASISTATLSGGIFSYTFNQQFSYTNTNDNSLVVANISTTALANSNFTIANTNLYANQVVITSINNTINLVNNTNFPGFPTNLSSITISNRTGIHNSFKLVIDGTTNQPAIGFFSATNTLANGIPNFTGTILGLEQNSPNIKLWVADPRMLPYRGIGSSFSYADIPYTNTIWGSYPARTTPFVSGSPANWSDGTNTLNSTLSTSGSNYIATQAPNIGITSISDPAPCKISNFGSYTNICELGNIFDPIQWAPPIATNNYANCDINTNTGSVWTKNNMYGGGSTLRIGRPEHSLFAFTNFAGSGTPIPNMGQSAAALLDLFCVTNGNDKGGPFRTGGKININTAPYPVLAALAGGVTTTKDPNQVGSTVNTNMINSFATGVMKFRHLYPFLTPSQLLFISVNYGDANWTNSLVWSNAAVFSKNQGLKGVTSISDEGLEEWFSKIYQLSAVSSENYRVYIVAQLVDTNRMPTSPKVRKYVHFTSRPNTPTTFTTNTDFGVTLYDWTITKPTKKTYESPY